MNKTQRTQAPATPATMWGIAGVHPAKDVFGFPLGANPNSDLKVRVFNQEAAFCGLPRYRLRKDPVEAVLASLGGYGSPNLWVYGPTGAGKTSTLEDILRKLGRSYALVGCSPDPDMVHSLKGQLVVKGPDQWVFQDGPLTRAVREGAVLLLDEGDSLDRTILTELNPVLDGKPLLIPQTGEKVVPHPEFRVFLTGNTNGHGDPYGQYRRGKADVSFLNRFDFLEMSYMDIEDEVAVVKSAVPQMAGAAQEPILRAVIGMAADVRKLFTSDTEANMSTRPTSMLSTRGIVSWMKNLVFFRAMGHPEPLRRAFEKAHLAGCNPADRLYYEGVFDAALKGLLGEAGRK